MNLAQNKYNRLSLTALIAFLLLSVSCQEEGAFKVREESKENENESGARDNRDAEGQKSDDNATTDDSDGDGNQSGNNDGDGSNNLTPDSNPILLTHTETFTQNENQTVPLDVMVVVDNSGSMHEEQINLASRITEILSFVDQSDWRVAVRTTDPSKSGISLLVDKMDTTKTFEQKKTLLKDTIEGFGIRGSGNEQGIPMAVVGLKANKPNTTQKWLRPDSVVAVLIVSDEDNCSNGRNCSPSALNEASHLLNYLDKNSSSENIGRELGINAKVFAIIRRSESECLSAAAIGTKYLEAVSASNGLAGAICDSDYSTALSAMSSNLSVNLKLSFPLQHVPIKSSIVIKVNGAIYTSGFTVIGKNLQLAVAPPAGAKIVVNYDSVK